MKKKVILLYLLALLGMGVPASERAGRVLNPKKGIEMVLYDKEVDFVKGLESNVTQDGENIVVPDHIQRSMREKAAREYVNGMLDDFESKEGSFKYSYDTRDSAFVLMDGFWANISTKGNYWRGKGKYTLSRERFSIDSLLTYNYCDALEAWDCMFADDELEDGLKDGEKGKLEDEEKGRLKRCLGGDSVQTLSEFITSDDGYYYGDCDDFSMAYQTAYELSFEMSGERAKDSEFWKDVHKSLEKNPVYIMDVSDLRCGGGHVLNMQYIAGEDTVVAIEPQDYGDKPRISFKCGKAFMHTWSNVYEINSICNSQVCYSLR